MSRSIIFYISPVPSLAPQDQPVNKIQNNIRENFRSAESLPRWTLEHRMFRETTPGSTTRGKPSTSVGSTASSGPGSGSGPTTSPNNSIAATTNSAPGSQSTLHESQGSTTSSAVTNSTTGLTPGMKYLQCLTLSWYPRKTWIGTVAPSDGHAGSTGDASQTQSQPQSQTQSQGPETTSSETTTSLHAIPTSTLEDFSSLLSLRLAPLWTSRGGILSLRDGTAVRIADFRLRYGELVSGSLASAAPGPGGASGATATATASASRGTVCEIVYTGDSIPDGAVTEAIQDIWAAIGQGVVGVRAFGHDTGADVGPGAHGQEITRWMQVLRVRDGR